MTAQTLVVRGGRIDSVRPLDLRFVGALDAARRAARELLRDGVRQSHGIGPNAPVLPAARRELEAIVSAVDALLDRPVALHPRRCQSCGEVLDADRRADAIYCGSRCRQRGRRARAG